jgi:predicted nucleotidyltransferase
MLGPVMTLEESIRACLAKHPEVVAAFLFGSHAEGRAHRESDVDVGVLLDRKLCPEAGDRFERRVRLTSELIDALHENDVDLVILNDAPPLLGRRIVLSGRLVHCADTEAEHAFRRDVQIRAADLAPFVEKARRRLLEFLNR